MIVIELIEQIDQASQRAGTGRVTDKRLANIIGYSYPLAKMKKVASSHVVAHLNAVLIVTKAGKLEELEGDANKRTE